MKKRLYENRHLAVLAIFLLIHALACHFTTYFGDDYYYAAFIKNGTDYMLSENINHYLYTNGRALVHLLDELLLGYSFTLWRIASVGVMASLVTVLAKLSARTYRPDHNREAYKNALIAVCALISLTDIAILRQSFYWATGSLNYLFPATLTLWYVYLLFRAAARGRKIYPLAILAFFAAMTSEQASAAALFAIIWCIADALRCKKSEHLPALILNLTAGCIGFLTLFLAPGNSLRTEYYPDFYAKPFILRTLGNIPTLAGVIFGSGGLCAVIAILAAIAAHRFQKRAPILSVFCIFSLAAYLSSLLFYPEALQKYWFFTIPLLPLTVIAVEYVYMFMKSPDDDSLYFILTAAGVQLAMLLSPEFGARTLTASLVFIAVPIVREFTERPSRLLYILTGISAVAIIASDAGEILSLLAIVGGITLFIAAIALRCRVFPSVLVCISLAAFICTPLGYAANRSAHEENAVRTREYDPESNEALTLVYLPNSTHKYTMPYDDPYHQRVYLLLNGLSPDTEVVYKFPE